ncbi:MAG: hypothetical protein K8S97_01220 [Anaerolineae bacterium]|nr:hypothetical protein [Anaerolineae bacterium]
MSNTRRAAVLTCCVTLGRFLIAGRFGLTRARGLALDAGDFLAALDLVLFPRAAGDFAAAFLLDAPDLLAVPEFFLRVVDALVVVVERFFEASLVFVVERFDADEAVERPPPAVCFFAINT